MRIGIDISQVVYENTGVSVFLRNLLQELLKIDTENEYVLFFSSLRRKIPHTKLEFAIKNPRVTIKSFSLPPFVLEIFWNRLHILPIEFFVGDVDVFISSDWVEPPVKRAKKVTIVYDLIVYKFPQETAKRIIQTQRRKLRWVKKESDKIICISEATKKDLMEIFNIHQNRIAVISPGVL